MKNFLASLVLALILILSLTIESFGMDCIDSQESWMELEFDQSFSGSYDQNSLGDQYYSFSCARTPYCSQKCHSDCSSDPNNVCREPNCDQDAFCTCLCTRPPGADVPTFDDCRDSGTK